MNVKFKIARLCEVCDFQGGSQPPKEEWAKEPKPNYVRMLQIRDFTQSSTEYIEYVKQSKSLKYCSEDDVLIGRYGASVGKILSGLSGAYNVAIIKSIPNESLVSKAFIKSYFLSSYFQHNLAVVSQHRAAQAGFSKEDIAEFHIPLPSLDEQERIVAELDLLTGIIDKQKAQLKELDNLAQSIFYDMFGDPVENEKGWEIKEMGELFNVGSSKRVFESQWTESGVPFYRAREIVRMSKDEPIESPIFISEELFAEYSNRYGVPSVGDMMVTAVGTLGVSYIVKKTDRFYFKDGNILWFNSKGLCETRFIKDQYATDFVVNQIQGNANAAVVGTYTIMNAKKTRVIVPPRDLQKQYVEKVESIDKQKAFINQSIAETQKLFDYTMDKYFC